MESLLYIQRIQKSVLNIFTKEKYSLPNDVTGKNYILSDSGVDIIFLKDGNKVVAYNAINKTYKIIKELKNSYSTIIDTFGEIYLGKINLINTSGTIYDLNEKELFEASPKTEKRLYRYKNFACKFKETRPYVTLCYSYDYGKTWYEYKTEKMFTTVTPKGYYKDKYILLDVCFYDKKDKTNIMIGEFQK